MFDEYEPMKKLTPAQIDAYLDRIGYAGSREPCRDTLDALVWHHQLSIPFETIDCHDFRTGVDIHPDAIYDKIIRHQRGGHCLELNGSFYRLLISLGFSARPCMSRVLLGTDEFTHPIDHRTSLVFLEGRTLYCDVGLGGPMPAAAIDIDLAGWQTAHGASYAVEDTAYEGWRFLNRQTEGGPEHVIMFTTTHCFETDFIFEHMYMSFHPEALHVAHRLVNLRTADGYRSITDDVYREIRFAQACDGGAMGAAGPNRGDLVSQRQIGDDLYDLLEEKFGIIPFEPEPDSD